MKTLAKIVNDLNLEVLTCAEKIDSVTPSGGYCSDLLSCVMAGAAKNNLWITLQAHSNIVAVAALLDICAIIITEGAQPDEATLKKAEDEEVIILSTDLPSYTLIGKLWDMGLKNDPA